MNTDQYINNVLVNIKGNNYRKILKTLEDGYKGLFVILKVIRNRSGEIIAGDISNELNISTARVAVALKTLEEKKYIIKSKGTDDGRKTIVKITNDGLIVLEKRENEIKDLIKGILNILTEDEIKQLINILWKIKTSKI